MADSKSATNTGNSSTATDDTPRAARPGMTGPRRPTGRIADPTDGPAHETTEAVGEALRTGQDAVLRSVEMGTELINRLSPLTFFAAGEQDDPDQPRPSVAAFPLAAWADGVFDLVETGLTAQRRYVDQVLAAQRNLVGRVLETGTSIAAATQAELVRSGAGTAEETRSSRN